MDIKFREKKNNNFIKPLYEREMVVMKWVHALQMFKYAMKNGSGWPEPHSRSLGVTHL